MDDLLGCLSTLFMVLFIAFVALAILAGVQAYT